MGFISCKYCNKIFNSYFNRNRHQNYNCSKGPGLGPQPVKTPNPCEICGSKYRYPSGLTRHMEVAHAEVRKKKIKRKNHRPLLLELDSFNDTEEVIPKQKARRGRVLEEVVKEPVMPELASNLQPIEIPAPVTLVPIDLMLD